jgi:hypothetical protein
MSLLRRHYDQQLKLYDDLPFIHPLSGLYCQRTRINITLRNASTNLLFLNFTVILSDGWTQGGHKKGGIYRFLSNFFKNMHFIGKDHTKSVLLGDDFYH